MMDTQSTIDFLNSLRDHGLVAFNRCGSRETCNPPPTDTDEDWIVLMRTADDVGSLAFRLASEEGWHVVVPYGDAMGFALTLRCEETNLLITTQPDYFIKFNQAKDICKALNLLNKADRVTVHYIICGD